MEVCKIQCVFLGREAMITISPSSPVTVVVPQEAWRVAGSHEAPHHFLCFLALLLCLVIPEGRDISFRIKVPNTHVPYVTSN